MFRYVRPLGFNSKLDCKWKSPKSIAYERDLYQQPDKIDLEESQALELRFFQGIDDRAATALEKLDRRQPGTAEDRVALSQFMISLLHRSPSRLKAMRAELAKKTDGAPYENVEGDCFENILKSTANQLLAMLVESADSSSIVSKFKAFRIDVSSASKNLITSDRPITVSAQLVAPDAFMIMPYAPDRLVILTHRETIARSFSTQNPDRLVVGINQAIAEQSEDIVVASDKEASRMVDRLFLRPHPGRILDPIGLIRRKSPIVSFDQHLRRFSRADRVAMKYLGS